MDVLVFEDAGGKVIAESWAALASLHRKMAAVMGEMKGLEQDGTNSFQKYNYISASNQYNAVRKLFAKHGLGFFVQMADIEQRPLDKGAHTLVHLDLTFADGETGAMKVVHWVGEASDSQDKSVSKAATSGVKYALKHSLMVSTAEDDDEADKSDGAPPQSRTAPRTKPRGDYGKVWASSRAYVEAEIAKMGLTEDQARELLGVASFTEMDCPPPEGLARLREMAKQREGTKEIEF